MNAQLKLLNQDTWEYKTFVVKRTKRKTLICFTTENVYYAVFFFKVVFFFTKFLVTKGKKSSYKKIGILI